MKIVHFFRSPVGGIFRHVRDLLAEQSAAGHDVGIICDSTTGGEYEDRLFDKIRPELKLGLHRIRMARSISPVDIGTFIQSRKLISSLKPDVVHCHSAKGGLHGRLAAKFAGSKENPIRTFYCPHGGSVHYDPKALKSKLFFTAERFLEGYTDSLIFVSEYERNAYHAKIGKPSCPETVIYNGLSKEEFQPVKPKNDVFDFLYIGMMRDLKGPDVFLDALKIVRNNNETGVTAMFVGDGPDKPKYIEQITNLGLEDCVFVHSAMPAREAFAQAKIVVVPSRAESMPYLILEAVAAQKPVIATRVGGIPEIFSGREDELVTPGNANALAKKMQETLNDHTTMKSAVAFAKDLEKRFSLSVMSENVESAYKRSA